jgi:tRNA(Ile)-lysidine synthase
MAASRNSAKTDLVERVGAILATRLHPDDTLCVGLSGGCDSVVLLHILSCTPFKSRLSAVHVHHGLSPNADAWAAFCLGYCGQLDIPCQIRSVQIDLDKGLGVEAAARAARYAELRTCGAEVLLLAHHQDDQAETILFNLLRGSGIAGAAGIPPERMLGALRLLRPLLGVSRREIEVYAKAHGLCWVEDESNVDTKYVRNFLRHDVMPLIERRFPAAASVLAQSAAHFAEADALMAELAAEDWGRVSEGEMARVDALRRLSMQRLKNLLRYRLRVLGWQPPVAARLEEFARQLMTAAPDRHPSLQLPDGVLRLSRGRLYWLPLE